MKLQNILYVEDEPDIQAVAKFALERIGGFTVKICTSGEEAVLEAASFAPDMILLDMTMPGIDGPTTLKALREQLQLAQIPVAFMTAKVQPQEVAYYKSLGALDVIAKPYYPMNLAAQVRMVWETWHNQIVDIQHHAQDTTVDPSCSRLLQQTLAADSCSRPFHQNDNALSLRG